MNIQEDEHGFKYVTSLEDVKPEYTPIPCTTVLQFYKLDGRTTKLVRNNICPIKNLFYLLRDKKAEKMYYKPFRMYDLDTLYFYENRQGKEITEIESLRRYVYDGNVTLLFDSAMIKDTKVMLERVYKSVLSGEGAVGYKEFYKLLNESLGLEEYKNRHSNLLGFKTVCSMFNERIEELKKIIYNKNLTKHGNVQS